MGENFIRVIKSIIYTILEDEKILTKEWHVGKVKTVVSTKILEVYVDGNDIAQRIPCNPNVTFSVNDEVFVHFINGDSANKFVPYKRGV